MLIKQDNYVNILANMVIPVENGGLGLKGNELLVYAIIYGFSQDDKTWFRGSLRYLAEWCNGTKQGVQKNLASLIEKGLIVKRDDEKLGVKFCEYRVTAVDGIQQSCTPMQQSCPNNKEDIYSSPSDIDSNESISSPPKGKRQKQEGFVKPQIEDVVAYCIEHEFICDPYQFYDHFEANGWLVSGRAKMKDWVAALRNWERNERKRDPRFKA
jgi:predicted transcriptional regulator